MGIRQFFQGVFPVDTWEDLHRGIFILIYVGRIGSWVDVEQMSVMDVREYANNLAEQKRREQEEQEQAIKKARSRR